MNIIHKEKVKFKNVYHRHNKDLVHLDGDFDYIVEKDESDELYFSLKNKNNEKILHSDFNLIIGQYLEYCFFRTNDEQYIFILVKEQFDEFAEETLEISSESLTSDSILGFDGTLVDRGLDHNPDTHEYQEYLFQLPSTFNKELVIDALSSIGMTHNENIRNQIQNIFSFD